MNTIKKLLILFLFLLATVQVVGAQSAEPTPLPTPLATPQSAETEPINGQPDQQSAEQLQQIVPGNADTLIYHVYLPTLFQFNVPSRSVESAEVAMALSVDVNATRHNISPYIYGANLLKNETTIRQWQLPINRWGGNGLTRYNWKLDVYNLGDYHYFENVVNPDPGTLPNNSSADQFIDLNKRNSTATIIQTSIIGWTPADRTPRCGFHWNKYGWQSDADWWTIWGCGNGRKGDTNEFIRGNDPYDTSIPVDETFTRDWVKHLVSRYGTAQNGGVQFYALDNEPMIWHHNHRDVHPEYTSYDEAVTKGIRNGVAIKSADPTAKVMGPGVWGWVPFFRSSVDSENPNADPDYERTGLDFLPYYLQEMRRFEQQNGYRLLDYLDIHYYPQAYTAAGPISKDNVGNDAATNALRLRSTKDLWDTTYTSESWINQPTYVIPRMKAWINQYYPGTKLSISEYRWGGFEGINGALAQADVLGIFGREDVGIANLWDAPAPNTPGDFAFRMYRNYDNRGNRFGDITLQASSVNQDQLSIYAAKRSADNAITMMVINKTTTAISSDLALGGLATGVAQVYRYSSADLSKIVAQPNVTFTNGRATYNFAAESITLFVITNSTAPASVVNYIYQDRYSADWVNWSWGTNADPQQRSVVKNGTYALQVSQNVGWAGLYLHANRNVLFSRNDQLRFWIHGGVSSQSVKLYLVDSNNRWGPGVTVSMAAGRWQEVVISFNDIAPANSSMFNGIILMNETNSGRWPFYLDDIRHVANP